MYPISRRIKRSPENEELLKIDKQRLDVDQEWIPYQNDALNNPNKLEENHDPDQYEMLLGAQNSKHPEETTIICETKNSQVPIKKRIETMKSTSNIIKDEIESNISHYAIEKQKEELKDELPIVLKNQTDGEKFVIQPLELEEMSVKEWKNSEEMEDEENSQFEIINEDERIDAKSFDDDPSFKRMPKLWENRIPKKYFPPVEKSVKPHIKKDKMKMRFRRSVKEAGVNRRRFNSRVPKFTRYEKLDEDGDVILEWDPSDDKEVIFRVTAKTLGYVGIGFNEKSHMMGADILLAWIDDHTGVVNLLVSRSPIRLYFGVTMVVDRLEGNRTIDKS